VENYGKNKDSCITHVGGGITGGLFSNFFLATPFQTAPFLSSPLGTIPAPTPSVPPFPAFLHSPYYFLPSCHPRFLVIFPLENKIKEDGRIRVLSMRYRKRKKKCGFRNKIERSKDTGSKK
jgi:hypothetical protein